MLSFYQSNLRNRAVLSSQGQGLHRLTQRGLEDARELRVAVRDVAAVALRALGELVDDDAEH